MEQKYLIRRTAFLNVTADLSSLPDELKQEINNLRQAFDGEVNEDTIKLLDNVLQKYPPLKKLYDDERKALKSSENETERSKGFPPSDDNPKPESLAANNSNPPTPEKNTSNSQNNQPRKTNK